MPKNTPFHFEMSERKLLLRIFDVLIVGFIIFSLNYIFDKTYIYFSEYFWFWISVYLGYFLIFGTVFELYVLKKSESRFTVFKGIVLTVITTTLLYLFTPYVTPVLPPNRALIFHLIAGNILLLTIWRFSYITFITTPRFYKKVLFVGHNYDINQIVDELTKFDQNLKIEGYIDSNYNNNSKTSTINRYEISQIREVVKDLNIGEIIVANSYRGVDKDLYNSLTPLLKEGVPIRPYSKIYEDITNRILLKDVENDFYYYFPFSRSNQNKLYLAFCRAMDIFLSLLGLTVMLLILPFVIVINLLFNKGPLFYTQIRLGKKSKPFKIFKLRTMVKNAENNGAKWAQKNDVRITKFGKILRKTRVDELPQFINIFKGDMGLIGPRPERPEFIENLKKNIPFYETRHIIKPGLTGWAQVNAKYASSENDALEKLQYDLYYIKERSLYLDFRIFVKTISTVIFFRGQ
ncbi:exopolysaccharide biosynthesis polyprenyl glycosylphosphotransferase [Flavobacteriaceae bacterium 14752]|uniref:exopolysaccharide biosynthesis polyprenyl glycosylphosphotransferase n=1 Tax=Mesohalobacter salilacus TaxID=2491711 RepID=UPI000F6448E5|nr:exopolysaccharide biosynthesis polyprenyl glycosylphosphotransferase [Flavobacteriaceae bacterium 14752]